MTVYEGAPADLEGRCEKEQEVYRFLATLPLTYRRVDHEKAETMEACAEIDAALGFPICKNLFLCNRQKTAFYLLLLSGEKSFSTKEVSKELGVARLSFGTAEDMERYLGVLPGSVSVFGLLRDTEHAVQLLIDRDLLSRPQFGAHPLINTSTLAFATKDLTDVILPALGVTPRVITVGANV